MGFEEELALLAGGYTPPTKAEAKIATLLKNKQEKLTNLANTKGYSSSLTPQQNLSNAIDSQVYYDKPVPYQIDYMLDENGISQGTREVPYGDFNKYGKLDTRDLYIDDTLQGNMKLGLARTDQGGYEGRYDTNLHPDWETAANGQLSGTEGVTTEDGALMNVTLPYNYATEFEYGVHTNPEQIANRAMGVGPKTDETQARFGSGQTEYTTQNAPMWNVDSVPIDADVSNAATVGEPKYHQVYRASAEPQQMTDQEINDMFDTDTVGGVYEGVDALQSGALQFGSEFDKLLDKTIEAMGLTEVSKSVDKFFGLEDTAKGFSEYTSQFIGEDGQANADMAAGVQRASRIYQQANRKVAEAAFDRGELAWKNGDYVGYIHAKSEEYIANAQNIFMDLGDSASEMAAIALKAPGIALATAVRSSKNADDYKTNNNGSNMPADQVVLSVILNGTSLTAEGMILKTGVGGAIKAFTGKSKIADKILGFIGSTAGEYTQERFDYTIETFLGRDRSKDKGTAFDTFKAIWSSKEAQLAGNTGAAMAATLKGGSEVVGTVSSKIVGADARKNLQDKITGMAEKAKKPKTKPVTEAQLKLSDDLDKMAEIAKRKTDVPSLNKILEKLSTYNLDNDEVQAKASMVRRQVADKLSAEDIANIKDLNLGSEEEATYFIEEMYQNATDKDSRTLLKNMVKVGREFGITADTIRTIKDTAAVEIEATTSSKGYKTYDKDLIRLKKSPEANSKAIKRVEDTLLNFQATQEDRLDRIQRAVNEIEANLKSGTESRTKVNVPYAGGGQYTIHIKNGKINPATIGGINSKGEEVEGVLADIQRTIDGINKVVERHGIVDETVKVDPYAVKGKFRVPDKMPYKTKGKGGSYEFVRNLKKEIAAGNTIVTPIFSKRDKKHISTVNKLKKEGYTEVDKNGHIKEKTGIWVPKTLGTVDTEAEALKQQKKEQSEVKKEATRLGKKQSSGAKLEPKEQKFVEEHAAEVNQVKHEMDVIKNIETIDTQLEAKKEKLGLLEKDGNDWSTTKGEIDVLEAERAEYLSGAEIQTILKNSSSAKTDTPKSKIGGVKFKQPININEYVEEKASPSLLGSVYVKYFENKVVKEAIAVAKTLKDILAPVDYKDDPKMTRAKLQKEMLQTISSPARGLIFNTKGEVNENVAVAMEAALTEYIAMGSVNLGTKTENDVARLLGLKPNEKPNSKQMAAFRNAGNYTKNVADDIGKAIISSLGLKRNENIPQELYGKLVADLGNIAIELGKEHGVLDTHSMNLKEHNALTGSGNYDGITKRLAILESKTLTKEEQQEQQDLRNQLTEMSKTTVPFVRFTPMGKDMVEMYKINHDRFKAALHLEDNFVKGPHKTVRKTDDKKIRNNPITEQPDDGQDVLRSLREEKYIKQDSVVNYIVDPANRELIKYHMGWKSEEDMKKMSFYARESQEAKNVEIERSIEFLETAELDKMYFEWFYSKNGRYMMDSNTLNPQTDKLHRFAIVPDNHKVDLDLSIDEHNKLFLTALAQAMNMSTDKKSTKEVLAYGQKMLDRGSEALMEDLKEQMEYAKANPGAKSSKAEHISHYLQGVEAVRQYEANGKSGKFTTHLSMESDAVTSGFGLKLLQLPILADKSDDMSVIEKTIEWLRKTGIFVGETVESMNDMVSMDDFKDSYETLAVEVKPDEVKEENYPEQGEGKKKWNPWKGVVKYDKHVKHEVFTAVLPTVDEKGDVSKELRTLFKDPFMTFNYSRGISSIKNGLGYIIADGLINKFVSGDMTHAEELLLADLKAVYGTNLVARLQSTEPSKIEAKGNMSQTMPDVYTYLSKMGTNTYGHLAAKSLNENFKAFNEANVVINKAFEDMFIQYNEKYLEAREKLETEKERGITKKEDDALIVSLRETFPLIKGPYSVENYSDSIAIYDSENVGSKNLEASYGTVSTKLAGGVDKKVQSKIRQLKASLKGGSVIPIHYIDAAIIGNTIKANPGTLGIHDAIIPNLLKTKEVVQTYNKDVIEVNRDYSVVGEIVTSYKRVIGKNGTDAQKETLQELEDLYARAQANRDEIFGSQIDVVHMSAVPGSKYTHNPKIVQVETQYNDAQKRALKKYFMKPAWARMRKEIDLKDC